MIKSISHIVMNDINEFMSSISEKIDEMQEKDLSVDVQYSMSNKIYSAFIIGRENLKF